MNILYLVYKIHCLFACSYTCIIPIVSRMFCQLKSLKSNVSPKYHLSTLWIRLYVSFPFWDIFFLLLRIYIQVSVSKMKQGKKCRVNILLLMERKDWLDSSAKPHEDNQFPLLLVFKDKENCLYGLLHWNPKVLSIGTATPLVAQVRAGGKCAPKQIQGANIETQIKKTAFKCMGPLNQNVKLIGWVLYSLSSQNN